MGIADGELTSIALCWTLERADGAGVALTSHDRMLVREAVSFDPSPGMVPASIKRSLGLDPNTSEVNGAFSSDLLDDEDLALGRWDGAAMQLTALDWRHDGADAIHLLGGEIGPMSLAGAGYSVELLGAAARLDAPVCPSTSPECRAQFGDERCRVDLAGRSIRATIVKSEGTALMLSGDVEERFAMGRLRYLSGDNCGVRTTVLSVDGANLRVRDLPRASIEAGCRVELVEGCDKRLATCSSRFDNAVNFRGEPHLPGNDLLTRYPGA